MKLILQKPDKFGVFASTLCMVHCLITPFIFIAQSCNLSCCDTAPAWWKWIDYLFLTISFIAVYQSTQTTIKKIMKPALWLSWIILSLTIANESYHWFALPKAATYTAALILVILHLYNLKYCQCKNDKCCTKTNS